ncbi:MAG: dihydroneopterin aldolase [Flavobacteriales bacterium]|nr:dihydroneopterin aldolase [Flavobacteriales bacterium]
MIEVTGIQVFAYHGCLPEEAVIGGSYRVDVSVSMDHSPAERTDALADTVDYGRVTAIVKEQMAIRSNLIEHATRRILEALKTEWPHHGPWSVRLTKVRPPIRGDVAQVTYQLAG